MNLPSWHKHVSERQSGSWVDCTPDSTVEWARLCHDKRIAATHAEGDALRTASRTGKTAGMNASDMIVAIKNRYNWTTGFKKVSTFNSLWNELTPGYAAMCQGSMSAFGPDHRLSRYDRNFDGGHAVCIMRLDNTDRVWWCDPEGPATGYNGEWVTKNELLRFVTAFAGAHLVAKMLPEDAPPPPPPTTGEDMPALTSYTPGTVATVKATANIRNAPKLVKESILRGLTAPESWKIIGTVKGDVDPDGGSDQWYIRWNAGRFEYTAKSNVTALVDPLVAAQADVVKAKAEANAASTALAVANGKILKARSDLA